MNITSFSKEKIEEGLVKAGALDDQNTGTVRLLFTPRSINDQNFDEVCEIYSRIGKHDFDTVVIVESHPGSAEKKLPMPSFKFIETKLGRVYANDSLRNDFADEDDDFFINDDAFDADVSIYDQLMMLQCILDNFSVLSIQITDESSYIVKELAYALEEILASKNALIIFCCDMESQTKEELKKLISFLDEDNFSGLMNYLNNRSSSIEGIGTFAAGLIVAKKWGLKIQFDAFEHDDQNPENLLNGYAVMQQQSMFG
jgi:AmmeMemoRadiSam system protein B